MKVLRVGITDDEWNELKKCITHHGHISYVLRQAIKDFITINERRTGENGQGGGSQRRGAKKA